MLFPIKSNLLVFQTPTGSAQRSTPSCRVSFLHFSTIHLNLQVLMPSCCWMLQLMWRSPHYHARTSTTGHIRMQLISNCAQRLWQELQLAIYPRRSHICRYECNFPMPANYLICQTHITRRLCAINAAEITRNYAGVHGIKKRYLKYDLK